MSARYAKRQIKWIFLRLDTIPLFPWSQRIELIVTCFSMRASELTMIHFKSSLICLVIRNTEIDGNFNRKPVNERHSVGSVTSGSPEVLYTTTQWIWTMQSSAMAHLKTTCGPPVSHGHCPSISPLFCFQKFLFTNHMHTCLLIILFFYDIWSLKVPIAPNRPFLLHHPPIAHYCFIASLEFLSVPRGAVLPNLGAIDLK